MKDVSLKITWWIVAIFATLASVAFFVFYFALLWKTFSSVIIGDDQLNASDWFLGIPPTLLFIYIGHYLSQKREDRARIAQVKGEEYENLISAIMNLIHSKDKNPQKQTDKFAKNLISFQKILISWGNPKIIKKWDMYMESITYMEQFPGAKDVGIHVLLLEDMIRDLRADIGISNLFLAYGDITLTYITAGEESAKMSLLVKIAKKRIRMYKRQVKKNRKSLEKEARDKFLEVYKQGKLNEQELESSSS